jgi:DNA-binding CsgD family transcriptional regulator/tetratricopeptide (TPR) repeat protein
MTDADDSAREAIAILEAFPDSPELAMAYSNVSQLHANAEDNALGIEWGHKTLALAERIGDSATVAHALTNIGLAEVHSGLESGFDRLGESLALARSIEHHEYIVRALSNIGGVAVDVRSYARAEAALEEGLDYLTDLGVSYWSGYLVAMRARAAFEQGRWDEAVSLTEPVLARAGGQPLTRLLALVTLGRIRARRGDPARWEPLEEARLIAEPTGELQNVAPVAVARAEAALLEGDADPVRELTEDALALATLRQAPWVVGELAWLRRRAGVEEPVPTGIAEPYALALAGEWEAAAARWAEFGCPYEVADALAASGDEDALRRALAEFERLGAGPAAAAVARRLRELVARGPRPATAENPANLTPREVEVLALVAEGLRNADIAQRLVVSQRTVDHHVSAILRKLGARSRAEAGAAAVRLGLVSH